MGSEVTVIKAVSDNSSMKTVILSIPISLSINFLRVEGLEIISDWGPYFRIKEQSIINILFKNIKIQVKMLRKGIFFISKIDSRSKPDGENNISDV